MFHCSKQLDPGSCARRDGWRRLFLNRSRKTTMPLAFVPLSIFKNDSKFGGYYLRDCGSNGVSKKQENKRAPKQTLLKKYLLSGKYKNEVSPNPPVPMVRVRGRGSASRHPRLLTSLFSSAIIILPSTAKGSIRLGKPSGT